jgi:hypothetical protein
LYIPPTYPNVRPPAVPQPTNGMGTASFVCGLFGVLLCWAVPLGAWLSIAGVVTGNKAHANGRRAGAPTGLALAGAILGGVGLLLFLVVVMLMIAIP